jgi:hypothetical protein
MAITSEMDTLLNAIPLDIMNFGSTQTFKPRYLLCIALDLSSPYLIIFPNPLLFKFYVVLCWWVTQGVSRSFMIS